jgi:raffinose/stachyose/melibiose transport system substrate-binding protein
MSYQQKKRLVALATIVATAALSGCAASTGSSSGGSGSENLSITWNANELTGIKAVIAAFKKQNPKVNITLKTNDGQADAMTALRAELSAGTATDITWVWPGNGNAGAIDQLAPGDFFVNLNGQSWVKDYPASMSKEVGVDGKTVMMAPAQMAFTLIVNETALKKYGLTAPTNWNQLFAYCAAAKKKGVAGIVQPGGEPYGPMTTMFDLVGSTVYDKGTQIDSALAAGKATFPTSSGWVEAMNKFTQLRDSDCYQPNSNGTQQPQAEQMVASGKGLGGFFAGVLLGPLEQLNPKADFQMVDFNANPPGRAMTVIQTIGGGAIPKKASNVPLALKFMDFLGTHTTTYADAVPGDIPTTAKDYKAPGPSEQFLMNAVNSGTAVHYPDLLWPSAATDGAMLNGLTAINLKKETGPQVLQQMQASLKP